MVRKLTGKPPGRPRKDSIVPTLVKAEVVEAWTWDPLRLRCLKMLFRGVAKGDVAKELGKHRSTIHEWSQRPEMRERLARMRGDHVEAVKARRVVQTTKFADKAAALLDEGFKAAEETGDVRAVKGWAEEFRAWRAQERIELGEDVKKTSVTFAGSVHVDKKTSHEISLKEFLGERLDKGVIDVTALQGSGDAGTLVRGLLEQIIADDPGVTDLLHEEDREASQGEDG